MKAGTTIVLALAFAAVGSALGDVLTEWRRARFGRLDL